MKTSNRLFELFFALLCLALLPNVQAVNPSPDGGYPGFNTAEGQNALSGLTTGIGNTAVGWFSLFSNTDGSFNTGVGAGTLLFNVGDQSTGEGTQNTAVGTAALLNNTTGFQNTANGVSALFSNTEGSSNTATGDQALFSNTEGGGNTADGIQALFSNTTGDFNTATGSGALFSNTTGNANTTAGDNALFSNTTGPRNTATGHQALFGNTIGGDNTAIGTFALVSNTTGNDNTAIGADALDSSISGNMNTALGDFAGVEVTTASNVICIGTAGLNVDDSCFIGNIYSNVQPIVGTDPDSVTITSAGRLGRGNVSSRRYKHDIKPMDKASEVLYALKPVSFRYNKEYDATQTLAFGLIAEEVAEVYPDLVGRNAQGQPESVRYEQINAMLLNEFLKEHRRVEELKSAMAQQRKDFEAAIALQQKQAETLLARLNEQEARIQKVSAQLETSSLARPMLVENP
jgi:hypothetical protein